MDISAIKVFNHLARSLHFGRTSKACHLSPSALTRTIQRIEEELGRPLFFRDSRRVALTPAGEIFRRYAEETEQRWQLLHNELAADQKLRGEISLYCSVTAATALLPNILSIFRRTHPGVQIKLQTGDAAEALEKLRNREAEIAIGALPDQLPSGMIFIELARTALVFIEAAENTGALPMPAEQRDWRTTPVILAERGLSRIRIDRWFAEKGIIPNIYAEVAGNEALLAMVSLGFGVGVLPELVLEQSSLRDKVRVFKAEPALMPFINGVCIREKQLNNPIIEAFWSTAAQVHKKMPSL